MIYIRSELRMNSYLSNADPHQPRPETFSYDLKIHRDLSAHIERVAHLRLILTSSIEYINPFNYAKGSMN